MAEENTPLTNYVAYQEPQTQRTRIGHYDLTQKTIQPLSFKSGTLIDNLYQVIEAGESNITRTGSPTPISTVKILPPLAARDVLCVGKNYAEHAKEFNSRRIQSSSPSGSPRSSPMVTRSIRTLSSRRRPTTRVRLV
jgi:2-keto-4-pentenoate hydratase/2-oxohepta-3-ene-1,7-dioic acid hydratase in catechol pathway